MFFGDHLARTLSVGYVDEPLIRFNETPMTAFSEENHGGFWKFGLHWAPGLLFAGHEKDFPSYVFAATTHADGAMSEADVEAHARGLLQNNGINGSVGWYRAVARTARQVREHAACGAFGRSDASVLATSTSAVTPRRAPGRSRACRRPHATRRA